MNEPSARQLFPPVPCSFLGSLKASPREHGGVCGLEELSQEFKKPTHAALPSGRTSRNCTDDNCTSKPSLSVVGSPEFLFLLLSCYWW